MSVWYSVEGDDERRECDWVGADDEHGDGMAEACAEHYHDNHHGWESSWPITLVLYESESGPTIGKYEVERIDVPRFYAREA